MDVAPTIDAYILGQAERTLCLQNLKQNMVTVLIGILNTVKLHQHQTYCTKVVVITVKPEETG